MDKILIIAAKLYNDPTGGGGTVVKNLIDMFIESFEIDLVLYRTPTENIYQHKQLKTYFHPVSYRHDNKFERRILNYRINLELLTNKYDFNVYRKIIIVHISKMFGFETLEEKYLSKMILFPMYLTPSYKRSNEIVPLEYIDLEQKALNAVSKIITPSESEKNDLVSFYHINAEKIEVIHRGVNEVFFSSPKDKFTNPLKLIVVSTIKEQKNVIESVQMISKLRDLGLQTKLTIIGRVESRTLYEQMIDYIRLNDLIDNVMLIQDLNQTELANQLKKSDILILPSLWETFGRVAYEAMAAGLPVVMRKGIECFTNLYGKVYILQYKTIDEAVTLIQEIVKEPAKYLMLSSKAIEYAIQFSSMIESKRIREVIMCKD
ncbi:MAG: glycosyltransferase family 4 protein [Firmicutes bacterium]|nr:glycosyltransferase family 4 protein [Bacillota bacterium]